MTASARSLATAELKPPARSLLDGPLLAWALVALGLASAFASPLGEALRALRLPDTDDAMRLAQVRDLVAGQSWFDMVQHRFLPPAGVASHWSRLVDAPLAAGILGLTPLVGAALAERIATALWPPLLFAVFALVLLKGMSPLFGRRAAVFGLFAALQTVGLVMQFAPGRIDHHNVQIVVMLGVVLELMRLQPTRWEGAAPGAWAGGLSALSLAVGLEALPLVALAGLVVALDWIRVGRAALPALCGFGLSLGVGATALFGIQTAPALWSRTACDALSPPWLWLAGTGAALAVAGFVAGPRRPTTRVALAGAVGALAVAGFVLLFPACTHGPFPDMPESVRLRWLDRVREMRPLWTMLRRQPAEGLGFTAVLFAGTVVAAILSWRDVTHRRAFAIAALFLASGSLMSVFQLRGIYVASGLVPLVAGVCLDRALAVSGPDVVGTRARCAFLAAALALNAQAWLAAGRIAERATGFETQAPTQVVPSDCSEAADLAPLDTLPAGTVLAPIDLGPYLLVHTHHAIVAAPYHRATSGLLAGLALLDGDEAELHDRAARVGARYLALCPHSDGNPPGTGEAAARSFAARLARGQAAAPWLEPLAVPGSGLKVWRLR